MRNTQKKYDFKLWFWYLKVHFLKDESSILIDSYQTLFLNRNVHKRHFEYYRLDITIWLNGGKLYRHSLAATDFNGYNMNHVFFTYSVITKSLEDTRGGLVEIEAKINNAHIFGKNFIFSWNFIHFSSLMINNLYKNLTF